MIVYDGQEEVVDASEQFSRLRALLFSSEKEGFCDHDRVGEFLIEWGASSRPSSTPSLPVSIRTAPSMKRSRLSAVAPLMT